MTWVDSKGNKMTEKPDNVIQFPTKHTGKKNDPKNLLQDELKDNKKAYIDDLLDHYVHQLVSRFATHGIDVKTKDFILHFAYTVESLRAALYTSMDIYHPLQQHIDKSLDKIYELMDEPKI